MTIDLSAPISQAKFATIVGISAPAVSKLCQREILKSGATAGEWIVAYCKHVRESAAGRRGELDLVDERAKLAQRQTEKLEMELAEKRGELVPVDIVAGYLEGNNSTWRARLLALPSRIRSMCPDTTLKQFSAWESAIRETLSELKNVRFPASLARKAQSNMGDMRSTAKAKGKRVGGQVPPPQP